MEQMFGIGAVAVVIVIAIVAARSHAETKISEMWRAIENVRNAVNIICIENNDLDTYREICSMGDRHIYEEYKFICKNEGYDTGDLTAQLLIAEQKGVSPMTFLFDWREARKAYRAEQDAGKRV